MERNGDLLLGNNHHNHPDVEFEGRDSSPVLSTIFYLDHVGEVVLTLDANVLSWELVDSDLNEQERSFCLGIPLTSKSETSIKLSDVYAVEFVARDLQTANVLANAEGRLMGHASQMNRFTVHGFQRSKARPAIWIPTSYTFTHKDSHMSRLWVDRINTILSMEADRPKSLLVFVHPRSGKGHGCRTWDLVAPIFSKAKVKVKVIVTERAGQAFDVMASISNKELNSYDGVISVGGDGFFGEILNGLLLSRHNVSYPPAPTGQGQSVDTRTDALSRDSTATAAEPLITADDESPLLPGATIDGSQATNPSVCATGQGQKVDTKTDALIHDSTATAAEPLITAEDESPLLLGSMIDGSQATNLNDTGVTRTEDDSLNRDQDSEFSFPNKRFRLGLIPAGSTDAIVICTTGARDPITSVLHIVLGKRVSLDIAQVVRWQTSSSSKDERTVRYAASFAGYGFYGDVITESESYRWMGPKRYDYAGTKVFLSHRSYEAEVEYLKIDSEETTPAPNEGPCVKRLKALWGHSNKSERLPCRANCKVCSPNEICELTVLPQKTPCSKDSKWLTSKGRYLSIGAAVISCRNEKAPDGLVADAHLSDGYLHLILIRDCPRALYLWHLIELTMKGGTPLNFDFVEHHKTTAFTFTSIGKESVWNVDGELFRAHKLSAQVFRGLISLFAAGPEV